MGGRLPWIMNPQQTVHVLRQGVSRIQKEAMILDAGLAYPNPTAGVGYRKQWSRKPQLFIQLRPSRPHVNLLPLLRLIPQLSIQIALSALHPSRQVLLNRLENGQALQHSLWLMKHIVPAPDRWGVGERSVGRLRARG